MPASERWSSLIACSLILLNPFVIFMRHHDYPLLRPEVLLAGSMLALTGLVFGLLLLLIPAAGRVVVVSGFVALFIDLQMEWIDSGTAALWVFVPGLMMLWPLRDHLGRIFSFLCTLMILATLALPPGGGGMKRVSAEGADEAEPGLPTIVHIILDEHIAIDGIPPEFDKRGALRRELGLAYLEMGFQVFERAFSRHFTTGPSLSHLVNSSRGNQSFEFYDPAEKRVTQNSYFEEMSRRGYRIHVFQTDYLDFCQSAGEINLASCLTYTLESITAIESAELGVAAKARTIAGMFAQRSYLLKQWRRGYNDLAAELAAMGAPLPAWPLRAGRMSTLTSRQMLPLLEEELSQARGGALYFVHLLLPHFPYAYDSNCSLRPSPVEWLTYKAPSLRPTRNDPGTRAERYPLYLQQVECTTRLVLTMFRRLFASDRLRDALVIIHGDHGSRINLTTPNQANMHRMSAADFTDAFSTHFAYRSPHTRAGLDERSIALDEILAAILEHGVVPDGSAWIQSQDVFITGERRDLVVHRPMRWGAAK